MAIDHPPMRMEYALREPKVRIRRPPLLILLHGIGSNEQEFLRLLDGADDRFLIASLRAPFAQTAGSNSWFSVDWSQGIAVANVAQAEYSRSKLINWINEAVAKFKIDTSQIHLLGHSQGAVIALSTVLSRPDLITSAAAINGQVLPETRKILAEPDRLRSKPILIIHGIQDIFYPISLGRSTSALLATLPVSFQYFEYHMGHSLTPESLTKSQEWLTNLLDNMGILGLPALPSYSPRLSAIHIRVRNLDRGINFYMRYLGMELTERVGKAYAFLSSDKSHHSLALINAGAEADPPDAKAVGMEMISFSVPDQGSLARVYQNVRDGGLEVTTIDHLISWAVRFRDPDGHLLEVFWDNHDMPGRSHLWQGRDLPLAPEKIMAALAQAEPGRD